MTERTCSIPDCEKPARGGRGWCHMHYRRWWKTGSTDRYIKPAQERFWEKVDKDGPMPMDPWASLTTNCWVWTAKKSGYGYGKFRVGSTLDDSRTMVLAHRFAYEAVVGAIPPNTELDHLCRVPACVRPDHLEPVSHRTNLLRGNTFAARQLRNTHCPQGHPYSGDNLLMEGTTRRCRLCRRKQDRNSKRRRRERERSQ